MSQLGLVGRHFNFHEDSGLANLRVVLAFPPLFVELVTSVSAELSHAIRSCFVEHEPENVGVKNNPLRHTLRLTVF